MKTGQKEMNKPELSVHGKKNTIFLDSSATSPSAQGLSSNTESPDTTTTQTRSVTPIPPSKRPRSFIPDTTFITSSSTTNGPQIPGILIT